MINYNILTKKECHYYQGDRHMQPSDIRLIHDDKMNKRFKILGLRNLDDG